MADTMHGEEAPAVPDRELLREAIERDEAELRDAVEELKVAVQSEFSLRNHIASRPLPWLVGGFAFGLWLGRRRD